MASGAIILVLMVLLTIISFHSLKSQYHVIFSQVVNVTYVLVGSMLGIIVAAVLANSVLCYYKRRENLDIQEHGVGGEVFVYATQKSVPDTSHTSNGNFTHHNILVPQSPSCPSCQCSSVPYVPEPKRISPTISHKDVNCSTRAKKDDQLGREITVRPDVFIGTSLKVVAVEVHNDSEIVQVTSGNSGQLESYC